MQLKYLIFETKDGLPVPVIFPEIILHKQVQVCECGPAISGGYVRLLGADNGQVIAAPHGESTSLRLRPKAGDSKLIEMVVNGKAGA
jgi:hypothetical protein